MLDHFNLVDKIYFSCIIISFLAAYILWRKSDHYFSLANNILALFFFTIGYCCLLYLLMATRGINQVPLLYKTAAPFNYLSTPLVYLYLRVVIFNQSSLRKKDWWHFLPFLLAFIDLVPFFMLPLTEKKKSLQQ